MTIIEDPQIFRPLVEMAIDKFGFAPEHNLEWFIAYADHKQKPVVAMWPNGEAVLVYQEEKAWYTFSEPLAPVADRGRRVTELADLIFKTYPHVEKVITEAREDTRQQIINSLSDELRMIEDSDDCYILTWPVMNMQKFDPLLPGGHFKSLRNAKSKFYRDHKVEIKNISDISKQDLKNLVDRWVPIATLKTEAEFMHPEPYYNIIEMDFSGITTARAMIVDDLIVGLNGGWEIPNSDAFYAAIGIHDYSAPDLGLMLYLEDLEWLKANGYKTVDMGGVEEGNPLNFKNQFLPESWYKTYVFSIIKK